MPSLIKKIPGYKIHLSRQLGKGSYGTVYIAEKQSENNLQCAVKVINKSKICKSSYLQRALLSQIKIMAKISSPNVVWFLGVLQSGNNYYIAQELCDTDLEKQIQASKNKFGEQKALTIIRQICNGFVELVKQGIVHRDIKPSNILLKNSQVKIADFGFAKDNLHKKIINFSNVGTPLYKAIQIFKGLPYTSKCDIWSIGIIFYQLCHGKTPFDIQKIKCQQDLILQIQKAEFHYDQDLSTYAKDFLAKTLQIYEKDRICWDQLYRHPIFKGYFEKYLQSNKKLENHYKTLMTNIRFMVNRDNINIKEVWQNLGYTLSQKLNEKQFEIFLKVLNPIMSKAQLIYIIQQIDSQGNGKISWQELQAELKINQIFTELPLQSIENIMQQKSQIKQN